VLVIDLPPSGCQSGVLCLIPLQHESTQRYLPGIRRSAHLLPTRPTMLLPVHGLLSPIQSRFPSNQVRNRKARCITTNVGRFFEAYWGHVQHFKSEFKYREAEVRRQYVDCPMAGPDGISMPPALLSLVPCRMQTFPYRLSHIAESSCR